MTRNFPLNAQGKFESEIYKKVEDNALHSFFHFQNSASNIINPRCPYFV